jgi:orotidine-5'-phosphate decarboxylase
MAYGRFCRELMETLKETVPAVRFSFDMFALLGSEGITLLQQLLKEAKDYGYYVLMDGPQILSPWAAERAADVLLASAEYACDGLLIDPYIGSDSIKPFLPVCKDLEKDLFVAVRSANKSAMELQDLLTGTRHVYTAAAEIVNRFGEQIIGKSGYSRICAAASAGSADGLRNLRMKHNRMFLLVDGLDYPSGNAKNCSFAFDRFGHGAVVCAGPSVISAWKETESDGRNYAEYALQAAERMRKNITRYVTIL